MVEERVENVLSERTKKFVNNVKHVEQDVKLDDRLQLATNPVISVARDDVRGGKAAATKTNIRYLLYEMKWAFRATVCHSVCGYMVSLCATMHHHDHLELEHPHA